MRIRAGEKILKFRWPEHGKFKGSTNFEVGRILKRNLKEVGRILRLKGGREGGWGDWREENLKEVLNSRLEGFLKEI